MHRPATFQDMLQLAERADQAFMADRNGALQSTCGNFERNNFSKNNMSNNQ